MHVACFAYSTGGHCAQPCLYMARLVSFMDALYLILNCSILAQAQQLQQTTHVHARHRMHGPTKRMPLNLPPPLHLHKALGQSPERHPPRLRRRTMTAGTIGDPHWHCMLHIPTR